MLLFACVFVFVLFWGFLLSKAEIAVEVDMVQSFKEPAKTPFVIKGTGVKRLIRQMFTAQAVYPI